jgi:hypothetical protein
MLPIALSDEAMREIIDAAALVPINLRNISKPWRPSLLGS